MEPVTDYSAITEWFTAMIADVTGSATTILVAFLGLLALVVGAFYLIGLAKKGVRSAK